MDDLLIMQGLECLAGGAKGECPCALRAIGEQEHKTCDTVVAEQALILLREYREQIEAQRGEIKSLETLLDFFSAMAARRKEEDEDAGS